MGRRPIDASAIAAMASRPGMDSRVWLQTGHVVDIGFDAQEGTFADVLIHPTGPTVTCYIGTPYAGKAFGDHCPVAVDDVVLVAIPGGDAAAGPWIISRAWSASDTPPPEAADKMNPLEPSKDRVIVVEANQDLHIVVSGTGNVVVEARGSGVVRLGASVGTLKMAIAPLVDSAVQMLLGYINALVLPVSGASAGPLPAPLPAPPSVAATKVEGI